MHVRLGQSFPSVQLTGRVDKIRGCDNRWSDHTRSLPIYYQANFAIRPAFDIRSVFMYLIPSCKSSFHGLTYSDCLEIRFDTYSDQPTVREPVTRKIILPFEYVLTAGRPQGQVNWPSCRSHRVRWLQVDAANTLQICFKTRATNERW